MSSSIASLQHRTANLPSIHLASDQPSSPNTSYNYNNPTSSLNSINDNPQHNSSYNYPDDPLPSPDINRRGQIVSNCCFHWCSSCSRFPGRRTSSFSQRNSQQTPTTQQARNANDPTMLSLPMEELNRWRSSFDTIMHSPQGRRIFGEYLKSEYSEENVLFWMAIEDYRNLEDVRLREERARSIYEDYISILSPKEVSLDSRVREKINQEMSNPQACIFDEAQQQIFTLMQRDSFLRFLNSSLFKTLVVNAIPLSKGNTASAAKSDTASTSKVVSSNNKNTNNNNNNNNSDSNISKTNGNYTSVFSSTAVSVCNNNNNNNNQSMVSNSTLETSNVHVSLVNTGTKISKDNIESTSKLTSDLANTTELSSTVSCTIATWCVTNTEAPNIFAHTNTTLPSVTNNTNVVTQSSPVKISQIKTFPNTCATSEITTESSRMIPPSSDDVGCIIAVNDDDNGNQNKGELIKLI